MYSNYSLPLFLSEYGCITNTRTFEETKALYGTNMTKVFSGGLVYEYSEEGNGYGLVNINGDTVTQVGSQFTYLQNALASVSDPQDGGGYSTDGVVQTCPDQSDDWDTSPFTGTALPAMPTGAEKYMQNGAGKGPGMLKSCSAVSQLAIHWLTFNSQGSAVPGARTPAVAASQPHLQTRAPLRQLTAVVPTLLLPRAQEDTHLRRAVLRPHIQLTRSTLGLYSL